MHADIREIEARILTRGMTMTGLGVLLDAIVAERKRRHAQMVMGPADTGRYATQESNLKDSNQETEQAAQGHGECPPQESDLTHDDMMADKMARRMVGAMNTEKIQYSIARMACRHDVREHRMRQQIQMLERRVKSLEEMQNAVLQDASRHDARIANTERFVGGRLAVDNAHSTAISEIDKDVQTVKSNIKNLYAMFERLNVNIENVSRAHNELNSQVNGRLQEPITVAIERRVKALESRLAKDWDKKRR